MEHSKVNSNMEIKLEAVITCPQCGFAKLEQMPDDT
jgi:hypothetical protein